MGTYDLIVSGGGNRGFFSCGVLYGLRDAGFSWGKVAGSSAGVLPAYYAACKQEGELGEVASEVRGRASLFRVSLANILRLQGVFSPSPLKKLIDFATLFRLNCEAFYPAFVDLKTGELVVEPHTKMGRENLRLAMLASMSYPGWVPPVRVQVKGKEYERCADAGLRASVAAEIAGARPLLIINSAPYSIPYPPGKYNAIRDFSASLQVMGHEIGLGDIAQAEAQGDPGQIQTIRPQVQLPSNRMDFSKETTQYLFRAGEQAAHQFLSKHQ